MDTGIALENLGYYEGLKQYWESQALEELDPARVIAEHKERYTVINHNGTYEAEVLGVIRFNATDRSGFPAVGDWVAIRTYEDGFAMIHQVLPRKTVLERQAIGRYGEKQIIAANIDVALIMLASDRDFNLNRLERYLTICYAAGISPVILLSKTDLLTQEEVESRLNMIRKRNPGIEVIPVTSARGTGYDGLKDLLQGGLTYCLLGSSGTGKSTLINGLTERDLLRTSPLSLSTAKGRHTTTRRELFILEQGGMIIDNPGMREVGVTDSEEGLESTFDYIVRLARECRYADCTHTHEMGCAVIEAVEQQKIDRAQYQNYLKMEREKAHFQSSALEKRRKDREFGKMVKEVMKYKKK